MKEKSVKQKEVQKKNCNLCESNVEYDQEGY